MTAGGTSEDCKDSIYFSWINVRLQNRYFIITKLYDYNIALVGVVILWHFAQKTAT